jgi:hypothetical protein
MFSLKKYVLYEVRSKNLNIKLFFEISSSLLINPKDPDPGRAN